MKPDTRATLRSKPDLREVVSIHKGRETLDGAGVQLRRIIGSPEINHMDPFLLFDVFSSDDPNAYIGGFPEHPHRGFETVTYLFDGRLRHRDNKGHEGVIEPGGVQWMRAARGIIHSEMPEQKDGLLSGVQLWVNLPKSMKMSEPGYQEYSAEETPVESGDGDSLIRVIAGRTQGGTVGPVEDVPTQPLFLDIKLPADVTFIDSLPDTHAAIVYVHQGSIRVVGNHPASETIVEGGSLATLSDGQQVQFNADENSRVLLVAAQKLGEPIVRAGPFVMNSAGEIKRAFLYYESGAF